MFFKIESCGRADSLQNANHCRPTVFVYIEVAFKCMGGCYGVAIILLYSENSYIRIKENGVHYALRFLMPTK